MEQRTALWLSHHWPEEYDRCVRVGHRHVCRRCAWFWPVSLATMVLALCGVRWPISLDPWLIALLPVPVVLEWWGEQLGVIRYSPSRQVALSALCAPAVGVGLARYLESPGDTLFWAVVAAYAVACLTPVIIGHRLRSRRDASCQIFAEQPERPELTRQLGPSTADPGPEHTLVTADVATSDTIDR